MQKLILLFIVLLVGLAMLGWIASSAAQANTAQAAVESARAAQISAAGQTTQSILITVLVIIILVLAAGALIGGGVLYWRYRRMASEFEMLRIMRAAPQSTAHSPALPAGANINQLMQQAMSAWLLQQAINQSLPRQQAQFNTSQLVPYANQPDQQIYLPQPYQDTDTQPGGWC